MPSDIHTLSIIKASIELLSLYAFIAREMLLTPLLYHNV